MLNKKIMLGVVALGFSVAAASSFAVTPGFYVGGQLGDGNVHQARLSQGDMSDVMAQGLGSPNFTTTAFANNGKDTGLAGRLAVGYQMNSMWAAELGWTKFSNMKTNASLSATDNNTSLSASALATGTIKTDAVDLVAKASYPLGNKFSVYGKGGAAYVMSRVKATASVTEAGETEGGSASAKEHKLFPTVGAGVSYDLTPNVAADVSYSRIQKVGSSTAIGSTDFVGVGMTYSFG